MRTALGWSLEAGEAEAGLRLAGALGLFWGVRGYLGEGRDWMNRVLAGPPLQSPVDHDRAMSLFRETIGLCRDLGNKRELAGCLDGLAEVATSVGHLERAVRLFGAAEALRRTTGVPERRLLRAGRDRDVAVVRAALGEDAFAASWAEGQAMTLEQALAEALGDEGEVRDRT